MSELRQNLVTKEWYVIATERARRPEDFIRTRPRRPDKPFVGNCPFCPGNESETPPALQEVRVGGCWSLRVVPNKYSAFSSDGTCKRRFEGLYREMSGVGIHEVIIETPIHNQPIPLMPARQVERIVKVYRDRYREALRDDRMELVIIFKNYGPSAGCSLEHPHSQLIATPLVPTHIRYRTEEARKYYDDNGLCVFCEMIRQEEEEGSRMVSTNKDFVAFVPYASGAPFEMWIMPRRHHASYSEITSTQLKNFASILQDVLSRLYYGLKDPDYNFVIRSTPKDEIHSAAFHWYLKLLPKLAEPAGFELGTGMYVNTTLPEENAEFLRNITLPQRRACRKAVSPS